MVTSNFNVTICIYKLYFVESIVLDGANFEVSSQHCICFFSENEAEASHIIYPNCDPLDEEYARPVLRRDRMVMMHWYYFPDSHDSWNSVELPVDPPDSPAPHTEAWRVSLLRTCKWSQEFMLWSFSLSFHFLSWFQCKFESSFVVLFFG